MTNAIIKENERKINKLQDQLFTKENIENFEYLVNNLKVVNKILLKMNKIEREKERPVITKTKLAETINLKVNQINILKIDHLCNDDMMYRYFIKQLLDNNLADVLFKPEFGYNGKVYKKTLRYEGIGVLKIGDKSITLTLKSVEIKTKNFHFLIMCNYQNNYQDKDFDKFFWLACDKDKTEDVIKYLESLYKKYNIFANQFVEIGSTGLSIQKASTKFNLDEIVLHRDIEFEIDNIINMFDYYDRFIEGDIPFKRGLLFYGEPGLGKTTVIQSLTKKLIDKQYTVLRVKGLRDQMSVNDVYDIAKNVTPCLIVLEDFDLIFKDRNRFVNEGGRSDILDLLENANTYNGIITIATTNLIEQLDAAAIRSGRIDSRYYFGYPTDNQKKKLIQLHYDYYDINIISIIDVIDLIIPFMNRKLSGAAISSVMLSIKNLEITDNKFDINKTITAIFKRSFECLEKEDINSIL